MMKDRIFEQNNGLRCMIKACLRRKLKRGKLCHIYVLIWCIFMGRFSTIICSDLVQIYAQI
ncbi:hypothetical protein MtrunA17_Chr7g0231241 [Medicago truncatula]|uniref:Transmembrane protein n=1 Tax=Medicago truncatula TaxID=3880 RepID=A0A396GYY8_MEDTR|nr:hypothetical protein MtrunA17_Chr7g0231241 [Medicago truncatula]